MRAIAKCFMATAATEQKKGAKANRGGIGAGSHLGKHRAQRKHRTA
jgi:hypothetical protein